MVFLPYLCSEFFEIWFIWYGDFSPFRLDCNILLYYQLQNFMRYEKADYYQFNHS